MPTATAATILAVGLRVATMAAVGLLGAHG
jgi:hypothetical protein